MEREWLCIFLDNETYKISKNQSVNIKIPSKIYFGLNYKLSPKWNTGLLVKNVMYENENMVSGTLSLNGYFGRRLSTSVSYTNAYSYHNLGLGIRLRILPGSDLFVVTDNLNQLINYVKAQFASLAFGINLAFGIKQKTADKSDNIQE